MKSPHSEVTISLKEYAELLADYELLNALQNGGVDNWEWYYESVKDTKDFDAILQELLED